MLKRFAWKRAQKCKKPMLQYMVRSLCHLRGSIEISRILEL